MIADTLQALVALAQGHFGATLGKVEGCAGNWSAEDLKRAVNAAPCVQVAFNGGANQADSDLVRLAARFDFYVVTAGPLEYARRAGGPVKIGGFEILRRLVPLLHGHTLFGIGTVRVLRVDNLFTETGFDIGGQVYAVRTEIPLGLEAAPGPAGLNDFLRFHADYDVPEFTPEHHEAWAAEDYNTAQPDAQDDIDLPQ
jgi:phage gp37-like protein